MSLPNPSYHMGYANTFWTPSPYQQWESTRERQGSESILSLKSEIQGEEVFLCIKANVLHSHVIFNSRLVAWEDSISYLLLYHAVKEK